MDTTMTSDVNESVIDSNETLSTGDSKLQVDTNDLSASASASAIKPSLKGILTSQNICKGSWAMSDSAHSEVGQTSQFEFKLVKADEDSVSFPFSGIYQGWFALKQPPKGSIKIDDKDMKLAFTLQENKIDYDIVGQGWNKFGSFNLKGTFLHTGEVHVYREYYNLNPLQTQTQTKRKASFSGGGSNSQQLAAVHSSVDAVVAPPVTTPRESSGRVRKVSTLMKEYEEISQVKAAAAVVAATTPKHSNTATPKHGAVTGSSSVAKSSVPGPVVRQESSSDRAQRLSAPMKKCGDLLKEMVKHPQAVWFLEPVDYVKFNIPDYPSIIKQPMDFKTVRQNLEALKYDTHEAFAEHVRLVFRNAMTFNTLRDNPVHIAAREMSTRFEDRYRQLVSQIGVYNSGGMMEPVYEAKSHSGAGRPSLGGGSKKGKSSGASGGYNNKELVRSTAPGPRPPVAYLPPAGDSGSHQIMEMQRMMLAMQEEINSLRSAVREGEIVKRLNETKDAAHNPLTFDEKKKLIAQIHKLPPTKMEQVLEIIQAAIPKSEDSESGDIEVPLDALDTFTLRKLQKYIEENATVKKRPAPPGGAATAPTLQRQNSNASMKGEPSAKKPRKSNPLGSAMKQNLGAGGSLLAGDHDGLMFDQGEDLLFSTDCFDEMRSSSQPSSTAAAVDNNREHSVPSSNHHSVPTYTSTSAFSFESAVAHSVGAGAGVGENSNESFRRPRAGSLDEDFEDLLDMKSPGHSSIHDQQPINLNDITVNNPDAWSSMGSGGLINDNGSATGGAAENGASSGMWSEAAHEFQARKEREEQRRNSSNLF